MLDMDEIPEELEGLLTADTPACVVDTTLRIWRVNAKRSAEFESLHDRKQELYRTTMNLERDARSLRNARGADVAVWTEHDAAQLAKIEEKIDRVKRQRAKLAAEQLPPALPNETVLEFLKDKRGRFVEAPPVVLAKVVKGSERDALAEARAIVDDKHKAIKAVHTTLVSRDEAEARIDADIGHLAAAGVVDFTPTTRLHAVGAPGRVQGFVRFPTRRVVRGDDMVEEIDSAAMIAWLAEPLMMARAKSALDAAYDGQPTLNPERRAKALADAEAALLTAERREEALVKLCEDRGLDVYRRPKADLRAVLGIV